MDEPELGGAPESREFHGREPIHDLRERWADDLKRALERNYERKYERAHEYVYDRDREGSFDQSQPEWVDHRSYQNQGIDRAPGLHLDPGGLRQLNLNGVG